MSDVAASNRYLDRELSTLAFNRRVLAQAEDASLPLLERLKFLCISSSNLDEFFEIRVAGLQQQLRIANTAGGAIANQLQSIRGAATELVQRQYRCLQEELRPQMLDAGVDLVTSREWPAEDLAWLTQYFHAEIEPALSPMALDPARPFPRIQNKSLNFVVGLSGHGAFGRDVDLAIVQAPRSLPRVLALPYSGSGPRRYTTLSKVMETFVGHLFPGLAVLSFHAFRLTRNSDLFIDEEEADDLKDALEGELAQRRYGAAVRLEVDENCPPAIVARLANEVALGDSDIYRVPAPVNLHRLSALYGLVDRPDLKYPPFAPALPKPSPRGEDWFAQLRGRDVLLHHPYESFAPVLDLLQTAARDPQVLAIKQTLYRTGDESPVVEALLQAAQAGKDVTVVIELRARFDEEANIELSSRLQDAGAHVLYGVVGFKTHAKMCLIVRREPNGIRRYCHLGTGNYHPGTARGYTDYGLMTADPVIGQDVHDIFLQLTSLARAPRLRRLLQAPFTLHQALIDKIRRETAHARAGRPSHIIAKMNALVETSIIDALYEASHAGVTIDLIVRGICCLRPQVAGLSQNIRVRSIIGRFLEHSRVYWFANNGNDEIWCASADWMDRNLFRRVEVAFPVLDPALHARVLDDLMLELLDNSGAWVMDGDGQYQRLALDAAERCDSQLQQLARATGAPAS
jgi:polyphosphate kinase